MAISLRAYLENKEEATAEAPQTPSNAKPKTVLENIMGLEKEKLKLKNQKAMLSNKLVDDYLLEQKELKRAKAQNVGKRDLDVIAELHCKNRAAIYREIQDLEKREREAGGTIAYAKKFNAMPTEEAKQKNTMRTAKERPPIDETDLFEVQVEIQRLSSERCNCKRNLSNRAKDDPKHIEWKAKILKYDERIGKLQTIKKALLDERTR